MKRKWIITHTLLAFITSPQLFALGNAPIQRIDVVNLLGVAGSSQTNVTLSFSNGISPPCFTTTLPFQNAITVWVGAGQACPSAITTMTITPVVGANASSIYSTPSNPALFSSTQYSTQITISENTSPIFDPSNGGLITPGSIQATTVSHWR